MHPIRDVPEITDVEQTVVGRSVVAAQPGAVHAKPHVQFLNGHVVDRHVVSALEKCGIDREKRCQTLRRNAACEKRRVFLCDTDVEITRWVRLGEM